MKLEEEKKVQPHRRNIPFWQTQTHTHTHNLRLLHRQLTNQSKSPETGGARRRGGKALATSERVVN